MLTIENGNIIERNTYAVEYFYNPYANLYCVVGETTAVEYLDDLKDMWYDPDLLTEVECPDYITEDYDAPTW